MRTTIALIIPLFIAILASMPACSDSPENQQQQAKEQAEEKAEYARRDTSWAYDWDQLTIRQLGQYTKQLRTHYFEFNEEYVDFDGVIFEGHWVSKRKFVINDTTHILVSQRSVMLKRGDQVLTYSDDTHR